jgi:hypothetical protein
LVVVHLSGAAQSEYESPEYGDGHLRWPRGCAVAAVGWSGISTSAKGMVGPPAGTYLLISIDYRGDRIARPRVEPAGHSVNAGRRVVDEPNDANYNRLVSLPYPASAEQISRDNDLYDLLLESSYVLIGAVDQLVDDLQMRRKRWGISYYVVFEDAFAPVVAPAHRQVGTG